MAITVAEKPESREPASGENPSATLVYSVRGTADDVQARGALAAEAPPTHDGLVRQTWGVEPVHIDAGDPDACLWTGNVRYQRRKRIIGRSLYGVDVMEWACHVAELRLWLALIVDADLTQAQAHCPKDNRPLLPNFSFKVRCGDSLVQEVGGIQFSHRRSSADVPRAVKGRLRRLRAAKLAYYSGQPDPKLKTEAAIRGEEVAVFRDLLAVQVKALDDQAKKLMRQQAGKPVTKGFIEDDEGTRKDVQKVAENRARRERQIERLMEEKERLKAARRALRSVGQAPFVWDIAFAEVLESDGGGFDMVIGNPPYVRTQSIADPLLTREEVTRANKKEYKAKLARSVHQAWPRFFGYNAKKDRAAHKIGARCELYVYFYFYGLSLLNPDGD